jgi:hypothetical protein
MDDILSCFEENEGNLCLEKNRMTHGLSVFAAPTPSSSASIALWTGVPPSTPSIHAQRRHTRGLERMARPSRAARGIPQAPHAPAAVSSHLHQHPSPRRWPHLSASPAAPVASGAFRCRAGGTPSRSARRPRSPQRQRRRHPSQPSQLPWPWPGLCPDQVARLSGDCPSRTHRATTASTLVESARAFTL